MEDSVPLKETLNVSHSCPRTKRHGSHAGAWGSREWAGGRSRSDGVPRPGASLGFLQERTSGAGSSAGPASLHDVAALGSQSVPSYLVPGARGFVDLYMKGVPPSQPLLS